MDAPVTGTVRAVVAAAQRRALLASIAGKALTALPWGAGAGLACVVIDRLAPTGLPWPVLALGPVAAAGVAACGWAWMTRPGEARVARRLDAALNLKSRVASSLELARPAAQADPAMVRLLAAQAEESARSIDVRRVFPVRSGRAWAAGPVLAALACAAGVWLPPGPWREDAGPPADAASPTAGADLPALRVELAEARELLRPATVVAEDAPARAQAQETLARVEQELAEGRADGSRARSTAAQALDLAAMEAEARARRRDEQADAALQRLAQLRQASDRPASGMRGTGGEAGGAPGGAISESLREGDLATAAETLRRAIDELQSLPPEARARLADELAQLARDLDAIEGGVDQIEPPSATPHEAAESDAPRRGPIAEPSEAAPTEPSAPGPGAPRPSGPAAEAARRALSEAGASPEQTERALGAESPERLRESLESAGVEPERAAELADRVQREREREAAREAAREQTRRLADSAREAAESLREPPSTAPAQTPATTSPPTSPTGAPRRPDARTAPAGEPRRPGATDTLSPQASPDSQPGPAPQPEATPKPGSGPQANPGPQPGTAPRSNPAATRQPDSPVPRDPSAGPSPGPSGKSDKPGDGPGPRDAGKPGESSKPGETGSKAAPAGEGGRPESGTPPEPGPSNGAQQQPGARPSGTPSESPAAAGGSPPATKPEGSPSAGASSESTKPESGQPGSQPGGKPDGEPGAQPSERPNEQPKGQPGVQPTPTPGGEPSQQPRESPSGAPPGAQGAPVPSRPGSPQAEPGAAPRTPTGAAENQPRQPESSPPAGAPSPERAPGKQPGTTSPQGRTNAPPPGDPAASEGAKPGEAPDLPDLPKDHRSLERLAKQIAEMADQRRRAGEDRKDAEALREMAQRWWDEASPDPRQQAERLARELARQRGSNGQEDGNGARNEPPSTVRGGGTPRKDGGQLPLAARSARSNNPGPESAGSDQSDSPGRTPGSPAQRTHVVDARSKGDDAGGPAARDRVMAQWLTNRPAAGESAPGDAAEARGILREAARAAQQAVDDRTLPRRYDRLLKRYFQHAPEELGLAPRPAPPPAEAPASPAPDK